MRHDLQGVYVYSQNTKTGRRLINIVDMSHTVSDSVQQIIRGPEPYDQIVWQKVSEGILVYYGQLCCNLITHF